MGIGASIGLIAIGAILALAINADRVDAVNIDAVGWILILAGIIGLVMTTLIWGPRRGRGPADVVEKRRSYDDRF